MRCYLKLGDDVSAQHRHSALKAKMVGDAKERKWWGELPAEETTRSLGFDGIKDIGIAFHCPV